MSVNVGKHKSDKLERTTNKVQEAKLNASYVHCFQESGSALLCKEIDNKAYKYSKSK